MEYNYKFNNYMPNASSTSKPVTCSSSECDKRYRNVCLNSTGDCTYLAQYAMADTASSGILMQDVLSFMNEHNTQDIIQLPIVFGCGKVQTGAFLRDAPNGLMGLGLDSFAVPTMLANKGIISDSFSMCFGDDGNGRLKFGDKGNPGQNETPLVVQNGLPYYNINITEMVVGNKTIKAEFTTLVDSGTNFALLEDPLYTQFTAAFSAQVEDRRITDPNIPLDYCYESNSKKNNAHPSVRFTTKGGSQFPMLVPIVGLSDENSNPVGYCLAVAQSTDGNVIGAIAMTGLNVVHDREKLVLGWQEADCYGSFKNGTIKPESPNSPPRPLNSWAPHVSASNVLNILICLFMMSLPVVLFD
ncbi:aspartyl protease family protein 1-like isoform X2 [Carex rostrata]